jgi:hypothetical protein
MARFLCVFATLLLACAVLATPAPEPFVSGWGRPVDPDGDCKIKRGSNTLIIEMPGTDHDYDPVRNRFNAPRILRELEGNFDLQIRTRIDCLPSAQSTVKGQPSFVSAGFLLIYPETDCSVCSRLEWGVMQQGIGLDAYDVAPKLPWPQRKSAARKGIGEDGYVVTKYWSCKGTNPNPIWDRQWLDQSHTLWDRGCRDYPLPKKAVFVYLRLEQRGQWLAFSIAPDGERWTELTSQPKLPAKSKVGLAAFSTSSEPSKVLFDKLKLTRGRKKDPSKEPLFGPSIYKASLSLPSFP